jgi:Protein of unknown function (DUF3429)
MAGDDHGPSVWARRLGYGGLLPFLGLAAALWAASPSRWPALGAALLAYGATITSFLGAIHWGLLMRPGASQPLPALLWGVTPSLLAWVALMLAPGRGLVLIALLLWACLAVDRAVYPRHRLQAWLPMRLWLTVMASGSCLAAAVALHR